MAAVRSPTPVLVVLLVWLVVPGSAWAAPTTARGTIRGVAHEFTVPDGWSTRARDTGIEFVPPRGVKKLSVLIVGVEARAGDDGKSLIGHVIDDEKLKKNLHDTTRPEDIEFAGGNGQLVILSGNGGGGDLEGEMLVVSVVGTTAYVLTCEGLIADMNAHVEDIAAIIGGVHVAGSAPGVATANPPPSNDLGDALRNAPAPLAGGDAGKNAGRAPAASADFILADGAFGVKLKPMRFWRLAIADDEYQLERTNESPAAVLAIRRVAYANEKKYLHDVAAGGGRSRLTRFADTAAFLVERRTGDTIERTYHILRGKYALVFEFRVVGRGGEDGADARVFEIEQAVVLADKGEGRWSDGATELSTYGGVSLQTTSGWRLASVGPGRANFRSKGGVEVEVRVRPWPSSKDPFALAEDAVKTRCGKDTYTRADAAVVGAASAVRFRCASPKAAQVVLVAAGQSRGGERVYVQVTAANPNKKGAPADAEIAEFGAYVALPR
jgi:hypothetical protein